MIFFTKNPNLYIYIYIKKNFLGWGGGGMARVSDFLSSLLAGKRDIVVTILVWRMCMRPCIRICPD